MKIVINGGGGVGAALAEILSHLHHDVTMIESDIRRADLLRGEVDCLVVTGNGASPVVLREAGTAVADIFLAVTNQDEVNLLSCLFAREAGCPHSIARIRNRACVGGSDMSIHALGIDQIINPDEEAAREMVHLLNTPGTTQVTPLAEGAVVVAGMMVPDASPIVGKTLAELAEIHHQLRYRVVVIRRNEETLIPTGDDQILADDEVFIIASPETVKQVTRAFGLVVGDYSLGRVMILGASDLGRNVAAMLEGTCRVKLIDPTGSDAQGASEELQQTLVIEGAGHEMDLLEREGLGEMDAFIAATDEEEKNLIACLYAKRLGVPHTLARVELKFYRSLMMTVGVDAAVSPRQETVNAILKYVRTGDIRAVVRMRGVSAEAIELVPGDGANILDHPLREVRFPKGALVGMVVRPEEVVIPDGDTQVHFGDRVVVFALDKVIGQVEKLFSGSSK
mgnify:FL=1